MADLNKNRRLIGTVIPVGALRGNESFGVGEFPDLVGFGELCKKMGIGLIQLLPVNDTGYQESPYFALTAFALHPLYLRLSELPQASGFEAKIKAAGAKFENEKRFPYQAILRAKMALLREIYDAGRGEIEAGAVSGPLAAWIEKNPWVKPYAVFRRLKEINEEKSWMDWPKYKKAGSETIEALWKDPALRREHIFWAWIQEALDRQFGRAVKSLAGMGIILEGDLPILINEDSCDVWSNPDIFNLDQSAGAPPDMYSPDGQNWGFPTFNWKAQAGDNYAWWKARLKTAEKYYGAYRIDHVLGFFRIWTSSRDDISSSSALGRFIPFVPVTAADLEELKFDQSRIRWLSRPHIPTNEFWDAVKNGWNGSQGELNRAMEEAFQTVLIRIGREELWLFKDEVRGSRDLEALNLHPAVKSYLIKVWNNRLFLEYETGSFVHTWFYRDSRAYQSLSEEEKENLEALLQKRQEESEKIWEKEGKKLLSVLAASSTMLPCAEDLGAVPPCVPKVLKDLDILGLRVVRWFRDWDRDHQPYIPFDEYPELTVCTPAVHDSSTLREWWDREADQDQFASFLGFPSLPRVYNPGTAKIMLSKIAAAASRYRVFQIQELLHLSGRWYNPNPADERINVPGTVNEFNWTWRLPATPDEIAKDTELIKAVNDLGLIKPAVKKPGKKPVKADTAGQTSARTAGQAPVQAAAKSAAKKKK
ncbi:MAG: 4-alpha-glucanotransferase [Treponema sp.]|nr:4-alpha-glucanotransferase [Treponema sp.]